MEGFFMPFAELSDVRCYYELAGSGEPVIFIPGLGATSQAWSPVAEHLSDEFTTICIDNRDIGQSVSKRPPHTVSDYSADLAELFDHLQIERAHIVGISMGGVIAQRFAVDHPSSVHRLVLISSSYQFGPYLREIAQLVGQAMHRFPKHIFERTMEVLGAGPLHLDANPRRIDDKIKQLLEADVSTKATMRQLRALGASRFLPNEYRIVARTLVIAGEFDSLIPHYYARQMAHRIDDSHFVLIRDAGHNPIQESPHTVMPLVREFLCSGRVINFPDHEYELSRQNVA